MVELTNIISLGRDHTLRDIAAMMRDMADKLERGEETANQVVVMIPRETAVDVFLWGDHLNQYEVIGVLETAKAMFVNCEVERT